MKISEGSGKKVDLNSAAQLFFVPNSATAILMPNYEILVIFFVPNYDDNLFLSYIIVANCFCDDTSLQN